MITFLHAIVLGVVEGVTEFLPVSSTAHLTIASSLLHITQTEFVKTFEIVIQLGAFLAIAVYLLPQFFGGKRKIPFVQIIAAFLPTAIIGFVLYKLIKDFLIGNLIISAFALITGGVVMLIAERYYAKRESFINEVSKPLSVGDAFILGIAQSIAVIPGVSRSGVMIIMGLFQKYRRALITEFTFLVGAPTIFAASGYDLLKSGRAFTSHEWGVLALGFTTTAIVTFFSVRWFMRYISKKTFTQFGLYRIYFGLAVLLYFFLVR